MFKAILSRLQHASVPEAILAAQQLVTCLHSLLRSFTAAERQRASDGILQQLRQCLQLPAGTRPDTTGASAELCVESRSRRAPAANLQNADVAAEAEPASAKAALKSDAVPVATPRWPAVIACLRQPALLHSFLTRPKGSHDMHHIHDTQMMDNQTADALRVDPLTELLRDVLLATQQAELSCGADKDGRRGAILAAQLCKPFTTKYVVAVCHVNSCCLRLVLLGLCCLSVALCCQGRLIRWGSTFRNAAPRCELLTRCCSWEYERASDWCESTH